ncbi:MAG: winged helix-turn-helix transcriptional regulator [Brevundimonas sp.]
MVLGRWHEPSVVSKREAGLNRTLDQRDDAFFRRAEICSVEVWLAFLGHRWNALILYHLSLSPKRFGELGALLPEVTPKVLSERLSLLVRRGIVLAPARRGEAYRLTSTGQSLMPILHSLEVWARPAVRPGSLGQTGISG